MSKISVIVPVYNVEKFLDICLDSLIIQTFKDFEIICVNDGSCDNSLNILEHYQKFDKRIKIINQENGGLSNARNNALKIANGKYITFVDSDDWVSPIMLEDMVNIAEKENSEYIFCNLNNVEQITGQMAPFMIVAKNDLKDILKGDSFKEEDAPAELWKHLCPCATGKLYKREFIKDFKFPEGLIFEDVPYYTSCYMNAKKISYCFKMHYFYRFQPNSITNAQSKRNEDVFKIFALAKEAIVKADKWGKYEAVFVNKKLSDTVLRMSLAPIDVKERMFKKAKEEFIKDIEPLKGRYSFENIEKMLKMDFEEYLNFEKEIIR